MGVLSRQSIRGKSLMVKDTISDQTDIFAAAIQRLNLCTAPCGQQHMVTYLMGSTSITSMATRATIGLRICRQYLRQIMLDTTALITCGSGAKKTNDNCEALGLKQRLGTQAQKVLLGIRRTAKELGKIATLLARFAHFAKKITKHFSQTGRGSAAEIVRLRRFAGGVPVYDLTVDHHHCYVANGMLVSNCDSLRYLFVGYRPVDDDWNTPIKRNLKGIA